MKKLFLVIASLWLGAALFAQDDAVILKIDGKPVYKSEFKAIYTKNNPNPKYDKASLDEYMELFINYKLKVAEAESLKMDTVLKFQRELDGYRTQLARPYLVDNSKSDELLEEAYERKRKEIKAAHILIKLSPNPTPNDTLIAFNKMKSIKKQVEEGLNFEDAARKYSEGPSAPNGGMLGYFTSMQMVYPFENAAYNTPIGKISEIVRTRFGYHIIKVYDERKARGEVKVAHIFIRAKSDEKKDQIEQARLKMDEVYQKLKNGEQFEELAKKYSEDRTSGAKGGELDWFGAGKMVEEFEDAAYALQNKGDFSQPVQSSYGFHIIKLIDKRDIPSFEEAKPELKNRISRDERAQISQVSFVNKLKKEYDFKENKDLNLDNVDAVMHGSDNGQQLLFSFSDQTRTMKDFVGFLKDMRVHKHDQSYHNEYNQFVNKELMDFENGNLENKYPEFKALMREYRDGILLFDLMDQKVWRKAQEDTTGLEQFFESHKNEYMWDKRYDAVIYRAQSMDIANQARALVKKGKLNDVELLQKMNEDSKLNLSLESNKFEVEDRPELKEFKKLKKNKVTKPQLIDNKYVFVKVHDVLPPSPKKLRETKGLVISDYQTHLEEEWMKQLRGKYNVEIVKDVLYSFE